MGSSQRGQSKSESNNDLKNAELNCTCVSIKRKKWLIIKHCEFTKTVRHENRKFEISTVEDIGEYSYIWYHLWQRFIGLLSLKSIFFGVFSVSYCLNYEFYFSQSLFFSSANFKDSSCSLWFDSFVIVFFVYNCFNGERVGTFAEFYCCLIVIWSDYLRCEFSFINWILFCIKEGLRYY